MRNVALVLLAALSFTACADEEAAFIAVSANGYVEAVPDILTLDVLVSQTGQDVAALQKQVEKTTRRVVRAAWDADVKKDDLDSSRISVQPRYNWEDGKRVFQGQQVRRSISIILREPANYGALLAALSALDIEQISPPRPGHSDLDELRLAAMDKALTQGRIKAERIADTMDVDLGDVIRVEELGSSGIAAPRMMMADAVSESAPKIEFGKRRISASVALRFAID